MKFFAINAFQSLFQLKGLAPKRVPLDNIGSQTTCLENRQTFSATQEI